MKKVIIYTDGACSGNPGPGGWAAIIRYKDTEKEISGGSKHTTNNKMELTAAIKALEYLKEICEIEVYTDSHYLKNGITQWLPKWQKAGWKNSQKKEVKNMDLWQGLEGAVQRHKIAWHWVKAHSGDEYNEKADKLAVRSRDKYKQT